MTRKETSHVLAMVNMLWPHSDLGPDAAAVLALWHSFLRDLDAPGVEAAVRDLAAQGREHAPAVGVIVKTAADRATVAPDWDQVRQEILQGIVQYRPAPGPQADPYAAPPPSYWSHPLIAEFIDGAWNEWRLASEADGTFMAQQREAWKALAARAGRDIALRTVGAERASVPGLHRPDYLAGLPSPNGTD